MLWLIAAIGAYFLFAITALFDRHLLSGHIPGPRVYACFVGILSIFALFLIPFGFTIPCLEIIGISLLAGAIFILACLSFYSALQKFEASRIVPCVGGILPLFTLCLSYIIFGEQISLDIWNIISEFIQLTKSNRFFEKNRKNQNKNWLLETVNQQLKNDFYQHPKVQDKLQLFISSIEDNKITPFEAAQKLIEFYKK